MDMVNIFLYIYIYTKYSFKVLQEKYNIKPQLKHHEAQT